MLLLVLLSTAQAACVSTTTFSDVLDAVLQAEEAYRLWDRNLLEARITFAENRLACLGDPIGRDLAASFHRVEGLRAFLEEDENLAIAFFAAARSIMPSYKFPEDLVPADHYIQSLYIKLSLDSLTRKTIPSAMEGKILFDGIETTERPENVPTIFQILDSAEMADITVLVMPGEPLPYYKAGPPAKQATPIETQRGRLEITPRKVVGMGLLGASAGGIAVSTYNLLYVHSVCHASSTNFNSCQNHVGPTWSDAVPYLLGSSIGLGVSLAGLGTGMHLMVMPSSASITGSF